MSSADDAALGNAARPDVTSEPVPTDTASLAEMVRAIVQSVFVESESAKLESDTAVSEQLKGLEARQAQFGSLLHQQQMLLSRQYSNESVVSRANFLKDLISHLQTLHSQAELCVEEHTSQLMKDVRDECLIVLRMVCIHYTALWIPDNNKLNGHVVIGS